MSPKAKGARGMVQKAREGPNIKQLLCQMDRQHGGSPQQMQQGRGKRMQTIDKVLSARNLTQACYEVISNKGAAGVDKMNVDELKGHLDKNRDI
jgi:hypothetical protein